MVNNKQGGKCEREKNRAFLIKIMYNEPMYKRMIDRNITKIHCFELSKIRLSEKIIIS